MKRLINYINNQVLVKTTSLQTASVLTKIIAGILTSKALAIFVGPVGLALVGNLRNFVSAFQSISILGFYDGFVKYVAHFKDEVRGLTKTISTVFYFGFFATIITSLFCYYNAESINKAIFPEYNDYAYVIRVFAIVLPFYALNMFSFGIMNGFSKYKILIVINIIGQVLSVSIALLLIYQNKIDGALISVVITESIIFLITLVGITNRKSLMGHIQASEVSFRFLKQMLPYSLMALFTAVILPLIALVIRSYIIDTIGYKYAGFWEAMNRISKYYLMYITSLLGLYILPRFAKITSLDFLRKEALAIYKTLIPILAVGFVLIFIFREYLVSFIFSEEFSPVEDLFFWQLLGDLIKILSMVIAFQFLAKKMFWHFIVTEAFLAITLYLSSIYFIDYFHGVKGAVVGHFVSYILYFAILIIVFYSPFFKVDEPQE